MFLYTYIKYVYDNSNVPITHKDHNGSQKIYKPWDRTVSAQSTSGNEAFA